MYCCSFAAIICFLTFNRCPVFYVAGYSCQYMTGSLHSCYVQVSIVYFLSLLIPALGMCIVVRSSP